MSTSGVRKRFRVDGVLTNMTSVKLSHPTPGYGVTRNDTGEEVVADNTTMTHISTGVYEYTWTDPEYDLVYTVWIEWVYDSETTWEEVTVTGSTAVGDLAMTWAAICDRIEQLTGVTTAGHALTYAKAGFRRFLSVHPWSFLTPVGQLSIGGASTATASGTVGGVVTATSDIFDASMVGLTMTISDTTTRTAEITGYTSESEVDTTDTTGFSSKTISVEASGIVAAPSDFGGIITGFTYARNSGQNLPKLIERDAEVILAMWRDSNVLLDAYYWALAPAEADSSSSQGWKFLFAPLPDEAQVLNYTYRVKPAEPSDTSTYPPGGPDMAEAICACGIAAAEYLYRKMVEGPAEAYAVDRLAEAIQVDKMFHRAGVAFLTTED